MFWLVSGFAGIVEPKNLAMEFQGIIINGG
jgi:hypothetical protein